MRKKLPYHVLSVTKLQKKIYTHTNILPKKLFFNKRSTKLHLSLDFDIYYL